MGELAETGSTRRLSVGTGFSRTLLVVLATLIVGCAGAQSYSSLADKDRFERVNRKSFRVHEGLDRFAIRPAARAYDAMPDKLQNRVSNFLDNLRGPVDISNNLLQGKFRYGFAGVGRFLLNSTIGLGGLFDPASKIGLESHPEDFGQTLAIWGVPSGPYLFIPVIGPSTARDLLGTVFDWQIHPITRHDDTSERNSLVVLALIDRRAELLSPGIEGALDRSRDRYQRVRSEYQQRRDARIGVEPPDLFDFE